jgi:predicted Na+-dependent transporter
MTPNARRSRRRALFGFNVAGIVVIVLVAFAYAGSAGAVSALCWLALTLLATVAVLVLLGSSESSTPANLRLGQLIARFGGIPVAILAVLTLFGVYGSSNIGLALADLFPVVTLLPTSAYLKHLQ